MMKILNFFRVCFNVVVASIVFVVTTVSGLIAWLLGAMIRGSLPDVEMDKSASRCQYHDQVCFGRYAHFD